MFGATFNLVTLVGIFGILKDGGLQINSLALNNRFSNRNVFQNGVNALSKMVLKTPFFRQKAQISCSLDHTVLFKFHQHVVQIFIKYCMERF